MVQMWMGAIVYGDIKRDITDEILEGGLIKYLVIKNIHWTPRIFYSIVWRYICRYIIKLTGLRVTNVVKYVNNCQNDGQQKILFYR